MRWFDRALIVALAGGLWASVAARLLGPPGAQAFDEYDVLWLVERHCEVTGEVYIYGMPYGEIENGQIEC